MSAHASIYVSMSRLRLSAHTFCIETGRWTKPNSIPVNERKCLTCNVIEDEYHFVLECLMYKDLRNVYIPFYYRSRPNMQKFVELIKNENENVIKKLCVCSQSFYYKISSHICRKRLITRCQTLSYLAFVLNAMTLCSLFHCGSCSLRIDLSVTTVAQYKSGLKCTGLAQSRGDLTLRDLLTEDWL